MAIDLNKRGYVRDAVLAHLRAHEVASPKEISLAATQALGRPVPESSVRSYLNLNVGTLFERVTWGKYRLL